MAASAAAPEAETLERALAELRAGRMVTIVDEQRSVGAVVMAAERASGEAVNFMMRDAGSWMCLALTPERCRALGLEPVGSGERLATNLMAPIDAADGIASGMTAEDRARTMRVAADPAGGPEDRVIGGHVQPFQIEEGGVLARRGMAEAAVDLARLAGCLPAAVVCEVQNRDGSLASPADLGRFGDAHGLAVVTVDELIRHRQRHDRLVDSVVAVRLPTEFGDFEAIGYRSLESRRYHLALVMGEVEGGEEALVHVHAKCTGDVFGSLICDCRADLDSALAAVASAGRGAIVYLGQGDEMDFTPGPHRLPADGADDGIVVRILDDLAPRSIRLLGEDTELAGRLREFGLSVTGA